MAYAADDLTPLLARPTEHGGGLDFGQGVVTSYDPSTGENTVDYRGGALANLPLLNTTDGLTLAPGAVVGILRAGRSYFILGRIQVPPVTESAAAFLRTAIAREIAAEIFADRITSAATAGQVSTTSASFVSLAGGPEVTAEVSDTGVLLVDLSCQIFSGSIVTPGVYGGLMSFQITGASSLGPSTSRAVELSITDQVIQGSIGRTVRVAGLNPGAHTISARYRASTSGLTANFTERDLTVTAF